MIEFSRSVARHVWAVFRRCVKKPYGSTPPMVEFAADAEGLCVRVAHHEVAAEYHLPGSFKAEPICLPMDALADFEGRGEDAVTLEAGDDGTVIGRWSDGGVPQVVEYQTPARDKQPLFPEAPEEFVSNPLGLLKALDEAVQTAAQDGVRFAVQRIQLRGRTGEVVATDGRQLLVQGGFEFPWDNDVLVARVPIFGGKELAQAESVEIGKTDKHVILRIGSWTLYLAIDKDARYPQIEQVMPKLSAATTHWRLAPDDAIFLAKTLPRLPGQDDENRPLTVDLNGEVSLRARAAGQARTTEVVLAKSDYTGKPTRLCMNREFLARALRLGFSAVHIINPDTPVLCHDNDRTYLAMPLPKDGALEPSKDALLIVSAEGERPKTSNTERKKPVMPIINGNGHSNGVSHRKVVTEPPEQKQGSGSIIAEAQALKDVLRESYQQANRLVAAIKRQRKQSKLMQSTLASLRQLQQIES